MHELRIEQFVTVSGSRLSVWAEVVSERAGAAIIHAANG